MLIYLYNVLTRPVRENALFMLFAVVLFSANWWFVRYPEATSDVAESYGQLALGLYLFAVLLCIVKPRAVQGAADASAAQAATAKPSGSRRARIVVWVTFAGSLTMYATCALESFLALCHGLRISPSVLLLSQDATAGAIGELVEASIKTNEAYRVATAYGAIGLVHIVARFRAYAWFGLGRVWSAIGRRMAAGFRRGVQKAVRWTGGTMAVCWVAASVVSIPRWVERQDSIWSYLFLSNSRQLERCDERNFYSAPLRMVWAMKFSGTMGREADAVVANTLAATVSGCAATCPKIVCIIGESYNKHHSALYGYRLPTTPAQQKWWDDGRLVVFDDVVSPWNVTSNALKDVLSTHSCSDAGFWTDGVLFPALFRKAGYRVAFLDNQFDTDRQQSHYDVGSTFFLGRSDVDTMCFDHRSAQRFATDGAFVRREVRSYKHHARELVFVHLLGQQAPYRERVPRGNPHKVFSMMDYRRSGLDNSDLQILADYDNACRYNDAVIDSVYAHFKDEDAIFVYFAAHGEYVFDGSRVRYGCSHESEINREVARNEFEVPMVVFFTPRFRDAHPDVVKRLEEVREQPMGVDDIPHLLMGLAGIRSPHYSPKHDILHPKYDATRKRILRGNTDYDGVMRRK